MQLSYEFYLKLKHRVNKQCEENGKKKNKWKRKQGVGNANTEHINDMTGGF